MATDDFYVAFAPASGGDTMPRPVAVDATGTPLAVQPHLELDPPDPSKAILYDDLGRVSSYQPATYEQTEVPEPNRPEAETGAPVLGTGGVMEATATSMDAAPAGSASSDGEIGFQEPISDATAAGQLQLPGSETLAGEAQPGGLPTGEPPLGGLPTGGLGGGIPDLLGGAGPGGSLEGDGAGSGIFVDEVPAPPGGGGGGVGDDTGEGGKSYADDVYRPGVSDAPNQSTLPDDESSSGEGSDAGSSGSSEGGRSYLDDVYRPGESDANQSTQDGGTAQSGGGGDSGGVEPLSPAEQELLDRERALRLAAQDAVDQEVNAFGPDAGGRSPIDPISNTATTAGTADLVGPESTNVVSAGPEGDAGVHDPRVGLLGPDIIPDPPDIGLVYTGPQYVDPAEATLEPTAGAEAAMSADAQLAAMGEGSLSEGSGSAVQGADIDRLGLTDADLASDLGVREMATDLELDAGADDTDAS